MRRATPRARCARGHPIKFLSTLSLRRATIAGVSKRKGGLISIHALLAESDPECQAADCSRRYFYPRSPCGERPRGGDLHYLIPNFYPRSPCGERRRLSKISTARKNFYPRSPCGERLLMWYQCNTVIKISIHALLAESDPVFDGGLLRDRDFYPRSPCGERPFDIETTRIKSIISIHALLAESDAFTQCVLLSPLAFLSTLSLRRATQSTRFGIIA